MDNKLVLISLRDPFLDSDRVMPPLGVMSLYSYMVSKGIDVILENDFNLDNIDKYKDITHFGISCMTPQKKQALEILYKIKSLNDGKKVIIGGPHTKFYLEECLNHPFDYIVKGDGEYALHKILTNTGEKIERVIDMPISESEMNSLPLPYRDKSFIGQYNFSIQGIDSTTILTSKGCPMSCAFCEDANSKPKYYSPEIVGKQIEESKRAGFNGIMFFDDLFAINLKRVRELTDEIKKHDIKYRCFGHAKTMTEDMISLLKDSGCIEIGFGAESGSQKILDNVNKKVNVKQNYDFVNLCNKYGIKVKAFFILGLPGEDYSTIDSTKEFLNFLTSNKFKNFEGREITNDFDLTIYYPYKGTKIRDSIDSGENKYDLIINKENISTSDGFYKGKHGLSETTIRTSILSEDELIRLKNEILSKYKERIIL